MNAFVAKGDLANRTPVFYAPNALDQGFSLHPESLVRDPQIDQATLAASIMWPGSNPLSGSYTYYEGLRRLQPGETATIAQDTLHIRSAYPAEDYSLPFAKAAAALGAALKKSIETVVGQAPDDTSSDCSGGIDSTTVALTAAGCVPEHTVLGLVQYSKVYPAGDIPYARRFAALRSNLILRELVSTADDLPFISVPPPDISPHEPYRGFAIFGRESRRLRMARQNHLSGDAGDALFDPEPLAAIADLLLRHEDDLAHALALNIGRAALVSPEMILENARLKSRFSLSSSYERVARQLLGSSTPPASKDWLPSLGLASAWLTLPTREALAVRAEELAKKAPDMSMSDYATRQSIRDGGDAHRHLGILAERYGVRLVAPYLNEAVLESVIPLPMALRIQPGQFKPLLRAAVDMAALAPMEIFTRQGKGTYSGELAAGFAAIRPYVPERLQNLRLARLGIIDAAAVRASLADNTIPLASLTQLLAAESWLAHLDVDGTQMQVPPLPKVKTAQPPKERLQTHGTYRIPGSLRIASGHGDKLVAFDSTQGSFHTLELNHTARLMLQTLAATHSSRHTLEVLQREYPQTHPGQLAADLADAIDNFIDRGWLEPVDSDQVHMQRPSALTLPSPIAQRMAAFMRSLGADTPTDAHHFACALIGKPLSILEANDLSADVVRNGIVVPAMVLPVGAFGVIGVLKSAHGLTHGLHSVIGLGGGNCLSVIARQGNVGIMPIGKLIAYYKNWLASIDFPGDAHKVRLYTAAKSHELS